MTTYRRCMRSSRRMIAMLVAVTLLTFGMVAMASGSPARADTTPPDGTPSTVSADALPTWQINGVVWSQVTIGDTVYAAGEFSQARPPGVSQGGPGSVNVGNLIAYNITTGKMITSFNPKLNAQALVVAKSPGNSRIYVGGDFTTADGQARSHIAAFDAKTGALVSSFHPNVDNSVRAIAVSDSTVYVGGMLGHVNGKYRAHLAALRASDGALLSWSPKTDDYVPWSMIMTPDQSKVVIGGQFQKLNGEDVDGLAAVDPTSGALVPWAATTKIPDAVNGAIMGLSTDGTNIYGSGWAFGSGASFEGEFSLDPDDGSINWLNDCQGDTYDTYPMNGALYTVSHVHNCEMIGGLTQHSDWSINQRHALAFDTESSGKKNGGPDQYGWDYRAYDYAKLLTWYPRLQWGSYTQQKQSGWSITGNGDYLAIGGEFPSVNGTAQYGLTRFAVKDDAPNKRGPAACHDAPAPQARAITGGIIRVSWQAATDPDNAKLTYKVYRSGTADPVYTTTQSNEYWNCPQMTFIDTDAADGSTYTYTVKASDPFGNTYTLPTTNSVTGTGGATLSQYAKDVFQSGASNFWRLGESSGNTVTDATGTNDATAHNVTRGAAGPITGDATTATTFNGEGGWLSSDSYAATKSTQAVGSSFSIEAWVKTTSSDGGKIVGYGSSNSGDSSSYDRHIYMDDAGHLYFGVYPGSTKIVESTDTYNDGQWHYVVAGLDQNDGMSLYVDGKKVAGDPSVTSAQDYTGYWRIGGDKLGSWPGDNSSDYFEGTIGDVAIYPRALSLATVQSHYRAGGGTLPNQPPKAKFTSSVQDLTATFDSSDSTDTDGTIMKYSWDFGDGSDAVEQADPKHTFTDAGTYDVTLTVTDDQGATDSVSHEVTVTAPPANEAPTAKFTSSKSGLTASFDASDSSDPDGSIASYAWDFGDGSDAGSGKTPDHTYADAGTYTVKLTVTDDAGATDSVSHDVSVTNPTNAPIAKDTFDRAVANGWGSADVGGSWSVGGGRANFDVADGQGKITMPSAASGQNAYLKSVSATDVDMSFDVKLDKMPSGSSVYVDVPVRVNGNDYYQTKLQLKTDGHVTAYLTRIVNGTETTLAGKNVPGVSSGDAMRVRVQASGTSPTTYRTKVWQAGGEEPSAWTVSTTDSTDGLQSAGSIGLVTYASGAITNAPITASFSNLSAYRPGQVPPPNQAPTAKFSFSADGLTATFDASDSSDPDGSIASYAWDFGDGSDPGSGKSPHHTYADAGTYPVKLTVTDGDGATDSVTKNVTVTSAGEPPVNQTPTARFTSSTSGLTATFDGSNSLDSDGSIVKYSWDFGDGSAVGSGATPNHTYSDPGTYAVKMTVTDDDGATDSVSHDVTVDRPQAVTLASDTFHRTVANGWGSLDKGGSWTTWSSGTRSVDGNQGIFGFTAPSSGAGADANSVSTDQSDVHVKVSTDAVQSEGSFYVSVIGRSVPGVGDYRAKLRLGSDGQVYLAISRMDGGNEVATVPLQKIDGLTFAPGAILDVRFQATGTNPTTLRAKAWADGTDEPTAWQVEATDDTSSMQTSGRVGLSVYLSGNAAGLPVNLAFDDFRVLDASTLDTQAMKKMEKGVKAEKLTKVTKENAKKLHALSKWGKP